MLNPALYPLLSFRFFVLVIPVLLLMLRWMRSRRGGDCFPLDCALGYWLLLIVFFYRAVFFNLVLIPADILFQYYPWRALHIDASPHNPLLSDVVDSIYPWMISWQNAVSKGVPLWNSLSYCGQPLAANLVSASLHPFSLFLLIMPAADVCTLLPLIRLFTAFMGTLYLLRGWNLPGSCCFFGGLMFAFCGVHIVWLSNYPELNVTMLMPWIFLCMEKIARGGGARWVTALALFSALQFLGGHPESSFHLYAFAVPFFFYRLFCRARGESCIKKALSRTAMMSAGGLTALMLCSFQLLPFLEYLPLTSRYNQIQSMGGNMFLSLDFIKVFQSITGTMVSPDFFGNPVDGNFWGYANYNEQNTYVTVTGLLLAVISVLKRGRYFRLKLFFIIAGIISFLIAARTPGVFEFFVSLPLFRHAGNHRLVFMVSFCLSVLGAAGLADLMEGAGRRRIFTAALFLAAAGGFLHLWTAGGLDARQLDYRLSKAGLALFFLATSSVMLLGFTVEEAEGGFFPRLKRLLPFFLSLMVFSQVFILGVNYNTYMERAGVFPETPLVKFLKSRPGPFRVAALPGIMRRGCEQVYLFDSITGMDPMKADSYEKIMSRINGEYNPVDTPEIGNVDSPWIDFLNVKYIAAPPWARLDSRSFRPVYIGRDGFIYENLDVMPRAFIAHEVVEVASREKAFELAVENEADLDRVSVIEHPDDPSVFERFGNIVDEISGTFQYAPSGACGLDRDVEVPGPDPVIIGKTDNCISIAADVKNASVMVISEIYYPGWRVFIDGKKAELLRANSSFMAVRVPAGSCRVDFIYRPWSFRFGMAVSALGILLLIRGHLTKLFKSGTRYLTFSLQK